MALIAQASIIMAITTETTTAEINARIPITLAPVAGTTIETTTGTTTGTTIETTTGTTIITTAGVMAVASLSPTEIIIRGIEAMILVVFSVA